MNRHWMDNQTCPECQAVFFVGCSQTHGYHYHVGSFVLCSVCGKTPAIVAKYEEKQARLDLTKRLQQVLFRAEHPQEFAAWQEDEMWRDARAEDRYRTMMKPMWDAMETHRRNGTRPTAWADLKFRRFQNPLERVRERLKDGLELRESEMWVRLLAYASQLSAAPPPADGNPAIG